MLPIFKRKRIVLMLLGIVCAMLLPGRIHAQFSGAGSGTANDPYLIFNPVQLNQVRNFLGDENVYFSLGADIDLGQWISTNQPFQGWLPIGTESSPFSGKFLGNGHSITGLKIDRTIDYVGFFGYTLCAEISDLSLSGQVKGENNTSLFIGRDTQSTINNITTNGEVSGSNNIGGLVGSALGSVIKNCKSNNTINGASCVGGLIGYFSGGSIDDCSAKTIISADGTDIGGIIGRGYYKDLKSSKSLTNLISEITLNSARGYVGGVIGSLYVSRYDYWNVCLYDFTLSGLKSSLNIALGDKSCNNIGGLIGYIDNASTRQNFAMRIKLQSSCAVGSIYSPQSSNVGGLVGNDTNPIYNDFNYITCTYITDSYFSGTITGEDNVGGVTGVNGNISRCYASGNVFGNNNIGGISGNNDRTITTSFALCSNISGAVSNVGRIYGSGYPTCGESGTTSCNYSIVEAKVSLNGKEIPYGATLRDGDLSSMESMKLRATYQGLGWDFANEWAILNTECLPYKVSQTAPPIMLSTPMAGSFMISGKCLNDGDVYVEYGGTVFTAETNNNTWIVRTDPLKAGERLTIWTESPGLFRSYDMTYTVSYPGSGTEEDPYLIYTESDLANINGAGYYKLMADLDLSAMEWTPVGRTSAVMTVFDGDNHTIKGLKVNQPSMNNCGLFSAISNATIKNLFIDSSEVTGGDNCGIIAGALTNCVLENVTVTNSKVNGKDNCGSITGVAQGSSFEKVYATGMTVEATGIGGGIVGTTSDNNRINLVAFNGNLLGGSMAGGIVGENGAGCSISCSCSEGTINASEGYGAGIAASNSGPISDSFSKAEISAEGYTGGISGVNYSTIERCYASGNLSSGTLASGITAYNDGESAVVTACAVAMEKISISSQTGNGMRVIGGIRNGAKLPTTDANIAFNTMMISINGVPMDVYDDPMNGTGVNGDLLRKQDTYAKMGWKFPSVWTINGSAMPELTEIKIVGTSRNDNYIYTDSYEASAGDIIEIPINLRNKDLGTTFQFDLTLPAGMSVYEYYDEDEEEDVMAIFKGARLTRTHNLIWKTQPNGSLRVVCTSSRLEPMIGDDGEIVRIKVKVGPNVVNGRYGIRLQNVMLDSEGTNIFMPDATVPVHIINDNLKAEDIEVMRGKTTVVPVLMDNKSQITGFQFDVYLPDAVSVVTTDDEPSIALTSRAQAAHTLLVNKLENNGYRVVVFSADASSVFSGNEGAVVNIEISVPNYMKEGDYDMIFKNIFLSNEELKSVECADFMSALKVSRLRKKGDVNMDDIITSADISAGMGLSLGKDNSAWDFWAADIDDNNKINLIDTKTLADMVLNEVIVPSGVRNKILSEQSEDEEYEFNDGFDFYYESLSVEAGGTAYVDLCLNNPDSKVSAVQWDVHLPEGFSFVYENVSDPDGLDPIWYEETDRTSGFILGCVYHADKEIYSLQHLNIAGGNYKKKKGAILTFQVKADENLKPGTYTGYVENLTVMDDMDQLYSARVEPFTIVVGDLSDVAHVNLSGRFDEELASEIATAVNGNNDLMSLDVTEVIEMPEGIAFSSQNPNALFFINEGQKLANGVNMVVDGVCENLTLVDGYCFGTEKEFSADEATYSREMFADELSSLYLPFTCEEQSGIEFYIESEYDKTTGTLEVIDASQVANQAVLVRAEESGLKEFKAYNLTISPLSLEVNESLMFGSYAATTVEEPVYTLVGGKVEETSELQPFRGYFTLAALDGITTGIQSIFNPAYEGVLEIYTTTGLRIDSDLKNLAPGLYIINGHKVYVK